MEKKTLKKKVKIFSSPGIHCGFGNELLLQLLLKEEIKDNMKELNYKSKHKLF